MFKQWRVLLTLVCAAMGLVGCGGPAGRKPVHAVSGKVTLSGGPVAGATVIFSPVDKQPVATATTDDEGNYKLTTYTTGDGAVEGNYTVLVLRTAAPTSGATGPVPHDPKGAVPAAGAAMHAAAKKAPKEQPQLPAKYSQLGQSDLKAKVEAKANVFDLALNP